MHALYNAVIVFVGWVLRLLDGCNIPRKGKFRRFMAGQANVFADMEARFRPDERRVVWVHAASMGEYGVARPLISRLKEEGGVRVVLTFFSPTGYEALTQRLAQNVADDVFYLPLDTPANARRLLDMLQPKAAVFIISEYWMNYLTELKRRNIPVSLVSAIIGDNSVFFRWYGALHRKMLRCFSHLFVLDRHSLDNLRRLGIRQAQVMGDPLFDNAIQVAAQPYHDAVIDRFCRDTGDVFIAGSISDDNDLRLVASLANRHGERKFIFVPHEISERKVESIQSQLQGRSVCYSAVTNKTDFQGVQVLIIDFVGALSRIYRYGRWAYVGGGFTPLLHSVIEATVYGLPVCFGPRIERKVTPQRLIELGVGDIVRNEDEIEAWYRQMQQPERLDSIRETARQYTQSNAGATEKVVEYLLRQL